MAIGAGFGLIQYRHGERYKLSFLATPAVQWAIIAFITCYYLVGIPFMESEMTHFLMCALYGLLVINCNLLDRPVVNLERKPLIYLGTISYGLYMFHMLVDYGLRFTMMRLHVEKTGYFLVIMPIYHIILMGMAIVLASLSYKHFENYFLRLLRDPQSYLYRLKNRYA